MDADGHRSDSRKEHKEPSAAEPQPNNLAAKERRDRKDFWISFLRSLRSLAAKKIFSKMIESDVLQCKEEANSKFFAVSAIFVAKKSYWK